MLSIKRPFSDLEKQMDPCEGNKSCNDFKNCQTCYTKTFQFHKPEQAKQWHKTKNSTQPWNVLKGSAKKYWFECNRCKHDFNISIRNITRQGQWCPFCRSYKMCEDIACALCYAKSFASHSPSKASQWSQKNPIGPDRVPYGSQKKYWFECAKCDHQFETMVGSITNMGSWCPYCSKKKRCVGQCHHCLSTSFRSFDIDKVSQWSERNDSMPSQVSILCSQKYIFSCKICKHDFMTSPNLVCRGHWCPFCANQKICSDGECTVCIPKTFASFEDTIKVSSWSVKNSLPPNKVFKGSGLVVIFDCSQCNREFKSVLKHVSLDGCWCPHCASKRNKAMEILCSVLDERGVVYKLEETVRLKNRSLHWDASCTSDGIEFFIESDGPHHFSAKGVTQASRGSVKGDKAVAKFNDQRARDLLKETYINVNNGLLFRFSYRQTSRIASLVAEMLEMVKSGRTGVVYMDDIYW
jgi:hypothetical protein